jgi:hypothetical protein
MRKKYKAINEKDEWRKEKKQRMGPNKIKSTNKQMERREEKR